MENEFKLQFKALFDAWEMQKDLNTEFRNSLERIEAKVDVLQLETAHLRQLNNLKVANFVLANNFKA